MNFPRQTAASSEPTLDHGYTPSELMLTGFYRDQLRADGPDSRCIEFRNHCASAGSVCVLRCAREARRGNGRCFDVEGRGFDYAVGYPSMSCTNASPSRPDRSRRSINRKIDIESEDDDFFGIPQMSLNFQLLG